CAGSESAAFLKITLLYPKANVAVPAAGSPAAGTCGSASGEDRGEGVLPGRGAIRSRNLPPPRHAELLSQRVAVRLRRPRRNAEALSDFLVRTAGCDQCDDLSLAGSDLRDRV